MGTTAAIRSVSEQTSWKADQRNFASLSFLGVSSVCSPKNGYMAYERIATWQTQLLYTEPYTAS